MTKRLLIFVIVAMMLSAAVTLPASFNKATAADSFLVVNESLPGGTIETAYSAQLQAMNGVPPFYWSVEGGSLPPGLLLDSATGIVSGIPTEAGTWSFAIKANDYGIDMQTARRDFYITVSSPGIITPPVEQFDFSLSVSPSDLTLDVTPLALGQQENVSVQTTVNVTQTSGSISHTVTLSLTGDLEQQCSQLWEPMQGIGTFSSQLTLSSTSVTSGDFQGVITATGGGVTRSQAVTLHKTSNVQPGDLRLDSVNVVQAVDGADLTVGKNTLFEASISSTFNTPITTGVELMLPAGDWTWEGHENVNPVVYVPVPTSGAAISTGVMSVPPYLSYVTTVTVPANGTISVVLPGNLQSATVQGYQVVKAPRPKHDGSVSYEVRVNPSQNINETDTTNNVLTKPTGSGMVPVYGLPAKYTDPTRQLKLVYHLCVEDQDEMNSYYPGGWGGTPLKNDYNNAERLAEQATSHILGTWPIADEGKLYYDIPESLLLYNPAPSHKVWKLGYMAGYLDSCAKTWGYDRLVAIMPAGWLGKNTGISGVVGLAYHDSGCFVDINSVPWVVTHELQHVLGYPDVYNPNYSIMAGNGYWVNEEMPINGAVIHHYMDYANSYPQWTSKSTYDYVAYHLPPSNDPRVLVFNAILGKDNSVEIFPFQTAEGIADPSAEEWNYSVAALDAAGNVLAKNDLNVQFTMYVDPAGAVPVDYAPVVTRLEWIEGTRAIELRDSYGNILVRRDVSANAPSVNLTSPQSGITMKAGKLYPITWEASDRDGDQLYSSLAISADKSAWTPIAMHLEGSRFNLDPGQFQPGSYYIKIKVTDGVNTVEDISGSFKIEGTGFAPAFSGHEAEFYIGRPYYKVKQQNFDMDVAPYIKDNRTFLPVRFVAYACGVKEGDISWDGATGTVQLRKGDTLVTLNIGSRVLKVTGASGATSEVQMDVAPEITSDRTMLPVRWVAEQFNYQVSWEQATATVRLESAE